MDTLRSDVQRRTLGEFLRARRAAVTPAYVLDRPWTPRAWNPPAARLFAGWLDDPQPETEPAPNLLRFVFLHPLARVLLPDWPERARRVLAEFRADCAAHLDSPDIAEMLTGLRAASPSFAALWQLHGVTGREGGSRGFVHARLGALEFDQSTFTVAGRPDLKLVILTPAAAAQSGSPENCTAPCGITTPGSLPAVQICTAADRSTG